MRKSLYLLIFLGFIIISFSACDMREMLGTSEEGIMQTSVSESEEGVLVSSTGGDILYENLLISIPQTDVERSFEVQVYEAEPPVITLDPILSEDISISFSENMFEINPEGSQYDEPIMIEFPIETVSENELIIPVYSEDGSTWCFIDGFVDEENQTMRIFTTHHSWYSTLVFGVVGEATAASKMYKFSQITNAMMDYEYYESETSVEQALNDIFGYETTTTGGETPASTITFTGTPRRTKLYAPETIECKQDQINPPSPTDLTVNMAAYNQFDWDDVQDESGVEYTICILDLSRGDCVIQYNNLPTSEFRLGQTVGNQIISTTDLVSGNYECHVFAVDGAGNWSDSIIEQFIIEDEEIALSMSTPVYDSASKSITIDFDLLGGNGSERFSVLTAYSWRECASRVVSIENGDLERFGNIYSIASNVPNGSNSVTIDASSFSAEYPIKVIIQYITPYGVSTWREESGLLTIDNDIVAGEVDLEIWSSWPWTPGQSVDTNGSFIDRTDSYEDYIQISNRIINRGEEDSGSFNVGFFLSEDETITTTDLIIDSKSVSSISPGEIITVEFITDFPESFPGHIAYMGLIADYDNTIIERYEFNNISNIESLWIQNTAPSVSILEGDASIPNGGTAIFTVSAVDAEQDDISYQWYVDDIIQNNENGSSFTFTDNPVSQKVYSVKVVAKDRELSSEDSTVLVINEPVINTPPIVEIQGTVQSVAFGEILVLTGIADDSEDDALTYKWFVDDTLQPEVTSNVYMFSETPEQSTVYNIKLSVSDGLSTTSSSFSCTVEANVLSLPIHTKLLSAGLNNSFYINSNNQLYGVGANDYGQLGDGTNTRRYNPVFISSDVVNIATQAAHSLILKGNGELYATGNNSYGQIGDGSNENKSTPVFIMDNVSDISVGGYHSLVLKTDGTLYSMGRNDYGQLGDSTTVNKSLPESIMNNVVSISAGFHHSLILKADGKAYSTGRNYNGQLGDSTTTDRATPVFIMDNVASISAGSDHSLFLKENGELFGAGKNDWWGALGDGTYSNKSTPVFIMNNVYSVSAGAYHTLILKEDRTLYATGRNTSGQLGDGTDSNRNIPVFIERNVSGTSAGSHHSLIMKEDEILYATGNNSYGQLGNGTTVDSLFPVATVLF